MFRPVSFPHNQQPTICFFLSFVSTVSFLLLWITTANKSPDLKKKKKKKKKRRERTQQVQLVSRQLLGTYRKEGRTIKWSVAVGRVGDGTGPYRLDLDNSINPCSTFKNKCAWKGADKIPFPPLPLGDQSTRSVETALRQSSPSSSSSSLFFLLIHSAPLMVYFINRVT